MSTGLDCEFFVYKGQWYYRLEQYSYRDEYDCYGPFSTQDMAQRHLRRNHANPGGWSESDEDMDGSKGYEAIVAKATK